MAASGTGAQQVMCLLDAAGVGVSHCLGVGGRDLSAAVGGRSTRQALAALAADPATELDRRRLQAAGTRGAGRRVQAYAATLGKPVHWATLGQGRPDLTAAAEAALAADGAPAPQWPSWPARRRPSGPVPGALRGLFCGGTLADEAMLVAGAAARPDPVQHPAVAGAGPRRRPAQRPPRGHRLRRRRPDPGPGPPDDRPRAAPRADRGRGAPTRPAACCCWTSSSATAPTRDPADELAEAITAAVARPADDGRELPVVVSLTGAEDDPQGLTACADHAAVRRGLGVPLQRPGHPPRPVAAGPRLGQEVLP